MEWKQFEEKQIELPEVVVSSLFQGFSAATKNLAELVIKNINNTSRIASRLDTLFQFEVLLISDRLPDYKISILKFGYDVEIYPVKLKISNNVIDNYSDAEWLIYREPIVCGNEDVLIKEIQDAFNSKRFTEIVSGLMKIASVVK